MADTSRNFRYRNRNGAWLDFQFSGLSLAADGALELMGLPRADPAITVDAAPQPGALAVSNSGEVFFTHNGHIARRTCTGEIEVLDAPAPRAMAFSRRRSALLALYEDRVVSFDLPGFREAETWYGFEDAHGLAVDEGGRVYIADAGGVRRFFLSGQADGAFVIDDVAPTALAIDGDRLYALDDDAVHVFDLDAYALQTIEIGVGGASALAAWRGTLYTGAENKILVLRADAPGASIGKVGAAAGFTGPVAALAVSRNSLWVHPGADAPVVVALEGAFAPAGMLWSSALDAGGPTVEWQRVRAWVDDPENAAVQFFVHTSDDAAIDSDFPAEWTEIPPGVTDFYVGVQSRFIRVGALIAGDGTATPRLRQIRTDFDQETWSEFLPEAYRLADSEDRFLERFLGAFRSLFDDAEDRIDGLVAMLDPDAVPEEDLAWLASFLAVELPATMSVSARRDAIRNAFELYALRGTAAGLRNAIFAEAGIHAVIEEPFAKTGWWQLPARSPDCAQAGEWLPVSGGGLGIGTVFPGASPQGAVLGAGAVLDGSHLITNEEFGMPLFADLAHRFNVLLYEGEVACAEKRAAVEAIIDRERPAHTAAHICVVKPAFRLGWQAILGVDTVVGGARAPSRLGEGALVLGGAEAGRIGESAAVGISTRL